jgi:PAS domain S-box-containing protein
MAAARRHPVNTWARAFETIARSREIVALIVDSEGVVRNVRVTEPETLRAALVMLVGRSLPEIFERGISHLLLANCKQSQVSRRVEEMGCLLCLSGAVRWFSVSAKLTDSWPHTSRLFRIVLHDVARRGRMHVRSLETGELLGEALDVTQAGVWEADIRGDHFTCSAQLLRMLEESTDNGTAAVDFLWRVIRGCYENLASVGRNSEKTNQEDLEFPSPFVGVRILRARTVCASEKAGLPLRFAGLVQDVTEKRANEIRLRKSEALLVQAEQVAQLGSWEMDVRTGKSIWSESLFRLLGFSVLGDSNEGDYWNNVPEEDRIRVKGILTDAIRDGKECGYVTRYRSPGGDWQVHQTRTVPVRTADGTLTHMVGVVQDISDKTHSEEALHRLSQKLIHARDAERRQIAFELHNSAGQSLAALKVTLGNLGEALPKRSSRAAALLESSSELVGASHP